MLLCLKRSRNLNSCINARFLKNYLYLSIKNIMSESPVINPDILVQYILVREDLKKSKEWNNGAVMAQACHASIAAIHTFYSHKDTQEYLRDLKNMHKVMLRVPDEASINKLSEELREHKIDFYQWFEQPENYCTSIALRPYPKSEVQNYLKNYKLYRN